MEKLVSYLKSLGLEHYCGNNRMQGIRLFFPPPKYEWKKRWFWPFGKGHPVEVQYADKGERKLAHAKATDAAFNALRAKLVKENYLGITTNFVMAMKEHEAGPNREKAFFITMVALDDDGASRMEEFKAELQKQGIAHVHPAVQENSAAEDLNPGGWSD